MAEEEQENQEEGGKSKKGLIIIIAAVIVIAASVGVAFFLMGGDDEAAEGEEAAAEDPAAAAASAPVYYQLKTPFLTSYNLEDKQRYMQLHMAVSSRGDGGVLAFEHHMPLIRSKLNIMFSHEDFSVLGTDEGRLALREKILTSVNELLEGEGEPLIEQVYFTNLVLQ